MKKLGMLFAAALISAGCQTETVTIVETETVEQYGACQNVVESATVMIETFTGYIDVMNDSTEFFTEIALRAAARGLVSGSETTTLEGLNDDLDAAQGALIESLQSFHRKAEQCF